MTAYADGVECPSCHVEIADDARFCSSCGHEIAPRADERRVVTVLFADIVGFTGLSEDRDPEQVKNLVDRCFALLADDITAFGGRVDKVIGDAIVALYGAPIAHEDDAERAVRAALRMQETVARYDDETGVGIRLRIGVNTGEVLVGALVAGDDYTAMGDVVNTASRLQTAAEPGTVLVGGTTQEATDDLIHYRSMGQLHARGREEPVDAFRALQPFGRPGERRRSVEGPLVGRDTELAVLREVIDGAIDQSRAQLITLVGESGLGKSRVGREVTEIARFDHDARVLRGRCLPYGEANIWWPIAEAIRGAAGLAPEVLGEPEVDTAGRVAAAVQLVFEKDDAPDDDADRVVQGLLYMMGLPNELSRLDSDRAVNEAIRSVSVMMAHATARWPLVLWLNDLHWADEAILELLDGLLDRLARRPLIVLVTAAPSLFEHWQPRPGRYNAISMTLDPLDDDAMGHLAAELLPALDPESRMRLVDRAGGNPLFLEEMARMMSGTAGATVDALPHNVRSVVGARLDALDENARAVISDAAVIGVRGDLESLKIMAEYTTGQLDVDRALGELRRADLLDLDPAGWAFQSKLVRDVVYDRLTKTDRAWRHAGIATWIARHHRLGGSETIAYHYRRAAELQYDLGGVDGLGEDLIDGAISWTIRAAKEQGGTASAEHVLNLYNEALALMEPADPRRAEVLLERARSSVRALRTDLATADLDEAIMLIDESGNRYLEARRYLLESEIAQWVDDRSEAMAGAHTALEIARELGDKLLIAEGLRRLGMVEVFAGNYRDAESVILEAVAAYEAADDVAGLAWSRQNLAWIAFAEGRMSEAEERLADAAAAFEESGDRAGMAWTRGLLAYVRIADGRFAEAVALAETSLEDAETQGDEWGQGMMHVALATANLWTGQVLAALGHADDALAMLTDRSDAVGSSQAQAARGRALVRAGRVGEGIESLRRSGETANRGPSSDMIFTSLVAAAATVGDPAAAEAAFTGLRDADPDVLGQSERLIARAMLAMHRGDLEAALPLLSAMPDTTDPRGNTWGWAAQALAAAMSGDDVTVWVDAVEASSRATYGDRVLARCAIACSAARVGDDVAARSALARAADAVPDGGDRVHPAIIAAARAECAASTGDQDAAAAATDAEAAFALLGSSSEGWRTLFRGATGR